MMAPMCTSLINAVTSCHLTGGIITKDDDSSLDERTSVDEKRDGMTLEKSNEQTTFFLGIDTTTDEGEIESEEHHSNHDTIRRRKQGMAYRSNQLRQSSLSIEFDMLTGLALDDYDNTEDEESDVNEEERRPATDDQIMYILLGPPTIKRMKKFWIYTEWIE
eukprot:scaffold6789_cov206-Skeletonema_marinoi.AAC.12